MLVGWESKGQVSEGLQGRGEQVEQALALGGGRFLVVVQERTKKSRGLAWEEVWRSCGRCGWVSARY